MTNIGNRICMLRNERNLKQRHLAALAGITTATLSHYESGKTLPTADIICRMADIFGITTDELLLGDDNLRERLILHDRRQRIAAAMERNENENEKDMGFARMFKSFYGGTDRRV